MSLGFLLDEMVRLTGWAGDLDAMAVQVTHRKGGSTNPGPQSH